jgi:queuine/archaeosine tRNA-ribosyltransferase
MGPFQRFSAGFQVFILGSGVKDKKEKNNRALHPCEFKIYYDGDGGN